MGPDQLLSEDYVRRISSGGPRSRWQAIQEIVNSTDPETQTESVLDAITACLGDSNSVVRRSAGYGLIRFGGFRTILNGLYNSEANVRYGAAEALSNYGKNVGAQVEDRDFGPLPVSRTMYMSEYFEATCRLVELLNDRHLFTGRRPYEYETTVAEAAACTLARWHNVVELPRGHYEGLQTVWQTLAALIRRLHSIGNVGDIVREAQSKHVVDLDVTLGPSWQLQRSADGVRVVAERNLQVRQGASADARQPARRVQCDYSPVACACAVRLLSKWNSDQAADLLVPFLRSEHDLVRCSAAHTLAELRPPGAFEAACKVVDDTDIHVSFAAMNALAAIDPSRAAEFLIRFAQRRYLIRFLENCFRPWSSDWPSSIKRSWAARFVQQ